MQPGILKNIRVLDFTRVLAGPYTTRILADFGAEVIKVQTRRTASGAEDNDSAYFNTWNRNKRSITLNMSHPQARGIVLRLAKISDVVVENFSPRVMSNWDLQYRQLKETKADIIMLSMAAMGQTGPWKDYVAFAPTIHSLGGLTHLTSYTSGNPQGIGYSYADIMSGLYGAMAVLAALEYRDNTGNGQYIDLSQYEALCTLIGPTLAEASASQAEMGPSGNRSENTPAAPYGCYPCRGMDRWCVLAVYNEDQWNALGDIMGQPEWFSAQKFSSPAGRIANIEELDIFIGHWTSQCPAEHVVQRLQEQGVPAGIVQNAADLATDPQLVARDFFVHLPHPTLGDTVADAWPIKCDGDDQLKETWRSAPLLGEANDYVFRDLLGMTESEVDELIRRGVAG